MQQIHHSSFILTPDPDLLLPLKENFLKNWIPNTTLIITVKLNANPTFTLSSSSPSLFARMKVKPTIMAIKATSVISRLRNCFLLDFIPFIIVSESLQLKASLELNLISQSHISHRFCFRPLLSLIRIHLIRQFSCTYFSCLSICKVKLTDLQSNQLADRFDSRPIFTL